MRCRPLTCTLLLAHALGASAAAQIDGLETEIVALDRIVAGRAVSTVRVFATLSDPAAQLNAVYGDSTDLLGVQTTDSLGFYQNVLGGDTSAQINPAGYTIDPNLRLDSWVALGSQDMIGNTMLNIGVDFGPFNSGGGIVTNNGVWFEIPFSPPCYPVAGRVLIAQLSVTSGETVSGTVNLFGKDGAGTTLDVKQIPFSALVGPVGQNYCGPANLNSSGMSARLRASGSTLAGDSLRLIADQLPLQQFGYFLASQTQGFVPNPGGSQGNICLGGTIARLVSQLGNSGPMGQIVVDVDTSAIPLSPPVAVQPGETWNFQLWFRDKNPGRTSNFTDAVAVTFN
ncbi:MAG TPA: hypothetical protein EYQ74_12785 [Planctomycetes bacterium]|nr:hypothetical protein [Planctomycetota bacterium]HIK62057.1 hypothetical protein [Planctomycetota bacterium]